jgi:HD-GYP domain-containing protein (c-di-GMP phosphodiesterase class II)
VCDAFTAMTFPRPYAAQLTVPDAIAELRRGAGTQFDPTVVDALANLVIGLEWPPRRSGANANLDNADRVGDRA